MSGRWIDPRPAAVHLPGYPDWVQSRVEALNRSYIAGEGMVHAELHYESYSEIGGGSGRQISPCHMEWLAKMWLLGGPLLPAPEPRNVPGIIQLLGLLQREPAPLGEWLLDLVVGFVRDYGWMGRLLVDIEHVGLRTSCIRYYWELMMGMVGTQSSVDLGASAGQREQLAARVVRRQHQGCSLFHVLQRALSLESREMRALVHAECEVEPSLLDDPTGLVLCGVAVRCKHQPVGTQHDAPRRTGALPELRFWVWDPDDDVEASLGVVHVPRIGWRIASLRRTTGDNVLEGSRLRFAAEHLCQMLDQLGGLHPHLAKYMATTSASNSWRKLGESIGRTGKIRKLLLTPTFSSITTSSHY